MPRMMLLACLGCTNTYRDNSELMNPTTSIPSRPCTVCRNSGRQLGSLDKLKQVEHTVEHTAPCSLCKSHTTSALQLIRLINFLDHIGIIHTSV